MSLLALCKSLAIDRRTLTDPVTQHILDGRSSRGRCTLLQIPIHRCPVYPRDDTLGESPVFAPDDRG